MPHGQQVLFGSFQAETVQLPCGLGWAGFHDPGGAHTPGGKAPRESCMLWAAKPSCLRLLEQLMRAAASRTFCTAGRRSPIRMAMIAITTNSSISVKPERQVRNSKLRGVAPDLVSVFI